MLIFYADGNELFTVEVGRSHVFHFVLVGVFRLRICTLNLYFTDGKIGVFRDSFRVLLERGERLLSRSRVDLNIQS